MAVLKATGDLTPLRTFAEDNPQDRQGTHILLLEYEDRLDEAAVEYKLGAEQQVDPRRRVEYQLRAACMYWVMGNLSEAHSLAHDALNTLLNIRDESTAIGNQNRISLLLWAYAILGQKEDIEKEIATAVDWAEQSSDRLAAGYMLNRVAEALVMTGDLEAAVSMLDRRSRVARIYGTHEWMVNPVFDRLHDRADFKALVEKYKPKPTETTP